MTCSEKRTETSENEAVAQGSVCLQCGAPLSFWRRRKGSRFCSSVHEELKRQSQARMLGKLLGSGTSAQSFGIREWAIRKAASHTFRYELSPATRACQVQSIQDMIRRTGSAPLPGLARAEMMRWTAAIDLADLSPVWTGPLGDQSECKPIFLGIGPVEPTLEMSTAMPQLDSAKLADAAMPVRQGAVDEGGSRPERVVWNTPIIMLGRRASARSANLGRTAFAGVTFRALAAPPALRCESTTWSTRGVTFGRVRSEAKQGGALRGTIFASGTGKAYAGARASEREAIDWNALVSTALPGRVDGARPALFAAAAFQSLTTDACAAKPAMRPATAEWIAPISFAAAGRFEGSLLLDPPAAALEGAAFAGTANVAYAGARGSEQESMDWNAPVSTAMPGRIDHVGPAVFAAAAFKSLKAEAQAAQPVMRPAAAEWIAPVSSATPVCFEDFRAAALEGATFAGMANTPYAGVSTNQRESIEWNAPFANFEAVRFTGVRRAALQSAAFASWTNEICTTESESQCAGIEWNAPLATALPGCAGMRCAAVEKATFTGLTMDARAMKPATQSGHLEWKAPVLTVRQPRFETIQQAGLDAAAFEHVTIEARTIEHVTQPTMANWATPFTAELTAHIAGAPGTLRSAVFARQAAKAYPGDATATTERTQAWKAPAAVWPAGVNRGAATLGSALPVTVFPIAVAPPPQRAETQSTLWRTLPETALPAHSISKPALSLTAFEAEAPKPADPISLGRPCGWQVFAGAKASIRVQPEWNERGTSGHPAELSAVLSLLSALNALHTAPAGDWKNLLESRPSASAHGSLIQGADYERQAAPAPAAVTTGSALLEPANVLRNAGRWEEAHALYLEARAEDYYLFEARVGMAVCRLHLGKPRQARHLFEQCLEERPESIEALFGLAMSLEMTGRAGEAIAVYQRVLELEPASVETLENLAGLTLEQGNPESAREYAARLSAMGQETAEAERVLAHCDLLQGDLDSAAQRFRALSDTMPESFEAWFNLGVAYHRLGRLYEAAEAYECALRLRPDSGKAWVNLGLARHESGDPAGAREAYARVAREPGQTTAAAIVVEDPHVPHLTIERVA